MDPTLDVVFRGLAVRAPVYGAIATRTTSGAVSSTDAPCVGPDRDAAPEWLQGRWAVIKCFLLTPGFGDGDGARVRFVCGNLERGDVAIVEPDGQRRPATAVEKAELDCHLRLQRQMDAGERVADEQRYRDYQAVVEEARQRLDMARAKAAQQWD